MRGKGYQPHQFQKDHNLSYLEKKEGKGEKDYHPHSFRFQPRDPEHHRKDRKTTIDKKEKRGAASSPNNLQMHHEHR